MFYDRVRHVETTERTVKSVRIVEFYRTVKSVRTTWVLAHLSSPPLRTCDETSQSHYQHDLPSNPSHPHTEL